MAQGNGVTVSSTPITVTVDNTTGSVAIDPLNPVPVSGKVKGTETLTATTSANAPITSVRYDVVTHGGSAWAPLCTSTTSRYTCSWDTTTLVNGSWDLRAVMTLANGATFTSSPQTFVVENIINSVSVNLAPGLVNGMVGGTETLTVTTQANSPITSVRYDVVTHGGSAWAPLCTPTTSPYTCSWDTTKVANGSWDLRAVMTLANGATVTSSTVTVTVVNLRAVDVRGSTTANGATEVGDTLVFTYSTKVDPGSIKSGWNGLSAQPVNLSFLNGAPDSVTVAGTNLGQVTFSQDYVKKYQDFTVTGNMTKTEVNDATVVTITLTSAPQRGWTNAISATNVTTWTPSASVTGFYLGGACAVGAVTRTGILW
jgi:hypothetical protein